MTKYFLIFGFSIFTASALANPTYCSAASYTGAEFVSWGYYTIQQNCARVENQILATGQAVDEEVSGYYLDNVLNYGSLNCREGQYEVEGIGGNVFNAAIQLVQTQNLHSCTIYVSDGGTNPNVMPYCSSASNFGAQYWSWTHATIQEDCQWTENKLYAAGFRTDSERSGYYSSQGLNYGTMYCANGVYSVQGYGANVFNLGVNLIRNNGLRSCTIAVNY